VECEYCECSFLGRQTAFQAHVILLMPDGGGGRVGLEAGNLG
jgi:hypothetical protein